VKKHVFSCFRKIWPKFIAILLLNFSQNRVFVVFRVLTPFQRENCDNLTPQILTPKKWKKRKFSLFFTFFHFFQNTPFQLENCDNLVPQKSGKKWKKHTFSCFVFLTPIIANLLHNWRKFVTFWAFFHVFLLKFVLKFWPHFSWRIAIIWDPKKHEKKGAFSGFFHRNEGKLR